jgi:hypothetical protein
MYWHQAIKEPDCAQFLKAAMVEVKLNMDNKHFILMEQKDLPKGPEGWRQSGHEPKAENPIVRGIYKWKTRLNAHRGQQEHGIIFWQTYAPLVNWFSFSLDQIDSDHINLEWLGNMLAFPRVDV